MEYGSFRNLSDAAIERIVTDAAVEHAKGKPRKSGQSRFRRRMNERDARARQTDSYRSERPTNVSS